MRESFQAQEQKRFPLTERAKNVLVSQRQEEEHYKDCQTLLDHRKKVNGFKL